MTDPIEDFKKATDSYMSRVVPKEAHSSQIRETKLAFISGGFAAFNAMMKIPDGTTDEQVDEMMKALHAYLFSEPISLALGR